MLTLSTEERLALLLSVLGQDASQAAFKSMHPTRAKYVQQLLQEFKADPPSSDEIEYVVQDFNNYFAFAMDALGPQIKSAGKIHQEMQEEEDEPKARVAGSKRKIRVFEPIESSGNPVKDLNRLDPFQIGTALADDHPKTVALVLKRLDTPLVAAVLEGLPAKTRTEAVVFLSELSTVPDLIVKQVLESTFSKANSVTSMEEEIDQAQGLADLMRALPKDMRNELIERLYEENDELVNKIRAKLYVFDDILRLSDRDIQKFLGEIETDLLIVALQKTKPELVSKLLDNLSKRARQTIQDEMQYKTGVPAEEIQTARKLLVDTLARLDDAGDISLI